jgi:Amt family ammonium transporter
LPSAKFWPQLIATAVIVGLVYPFFEGIAWNQHFGVQAWIKALTGAEFHDLPVVVHAVGGWIALGRAAAGPAQQPLPPDGAIAATRPPASPSWRWAPGF